MTQAATDCADLGLSVQAGIADTLGAAWALARFASGSLPGRSGDAIDQEAPATRARAAKRKHWTRGGAAPPPRAQGQLPGRIAPPGQTRAAISGLPVTALRLSDAAIAGLSRLGVRRIDDLAGLPRAATARRFGPMWWRGSIRPWAICPNRCHRPARRTISRCGFRCPTRSGSRPISWPASTACWNHSATGSGRVAAARGGCGCRRCGSMRPVR